MYTYIHIYIHIYARNLLQVRCVVQADGRTVSAWGCGRTISAGMSASEQRDAALLGTIVPLAGPPRLQEPHILGVK